MSEFDNLIKEFRILAKDKSIPIFTVDGELTEVLGREDIMSDKKYISIGESSKLINIAEYKMKLQ